MIYIKALIHYREYHSGNLKFYQDLLSINKALLFINLFEGQTKLLHLHIYHQLLDTKIFPYPL